MTARLRALAAACALVFLAAHLRMLPQTLEDIDSINLAMGVESFDVGRHQPHPPGYPIFIGLAKLSTSAVGVVAPSWERDRRAAAGLALLGVIAGALAAFVLADFWIAVGLTESLAFFAMLLTLASPLFWFTASRPLTDTLGLVAALAVQTWLIRGLRALHANPGPRVPREWLWGAVAAGAIIGLRSQTMWINGPLLAWAVGELLLRRRLRDAGLVVAMSMVGVLVWAVPLVWLSGGFSKYLLALSSQGAEDFIGVQMLVTTPTLRLLRAVLQRTLVVPWQSAALGNVVLGLALLGIIRLLWRGQRVLAAMVLTFWPYFIFHILFQETETIRYDLPIVVPVVACAVIGLAMLGTRVAAAGAVAIAIASVMIVQPRLQAYAEGGAPVFRAFQQMQRTVSREPAVLRMHHQVWWGIRRAIDWYRPQWDVGAQPFPGDREWLDIVKHWTSGRTQPVWFLTELARNDVALIDRRGTTLGGRFELSPDVRQLVGGTRLDGLTWWKIDRPLWMLGRGWSLTPEVAGMTAADGAGPDKRPAEAYLRRGPTPVRVLVGGRYLSGAGDAHLRLDLDGQVLATWTIPATPIWFTQWIELPQGVPAGPGAYAPMTARVTSADGVSPSPVIGLEQFDAAELEVPVMALGDGWFEAEEDPQVGRVWHWSTTESAIEIRGASRDVALVLAGESPLRNFDRAPTIVVRAGARELARFSPVADFRQVVAVPHDALVAAGGHVTIESDLSFVPGDRNGSPDRRRLALKWFDVDLVER